MKTALFSLVIAVLGFSLAMPVLADNLSPDAQAYVRGSVREVVEDHQDADPATGDAEQILKVRVLGGEAAGQEVDVTYTFPALNYRDLHLEAGDKVILGQVADEQGSSYYILDSYRLSTMFVYLLIFALAAIIFGRSRGLGSLVGLGVSLAILMLFVVPRIIAGNNPVIISFIGAVAIAVTSILLAHGLKRRTYVALAATLAALITAFVLAALAVAFAHLSGMGTEEAISLQINYLPNLDLRGLLLGGIIIGTLGVLDDVTTAQVAAVEEIGLADPGLGVMELYARGISVGREHIAALVNTLILAYAGASFPLFLLFALPGHPPLWVLLNSGSIIEEVLRALVGGTTLMLAVPISTALAAAVFGSLPKAAANRDPRLKHAGHHH